MEILNPIWFISLLSIPVVLIFLLISKKHRKIVVPSLLIWKRVLENKQITQSRSSKIDLLTVAIILVLLFICLTLAKIAFVAESTPKIPISIFIDDSKLMDFMVKFDESGKGFAIKSLNKILADSEEYEITATFPVSELSLFAIDKKKLMQTLESINYSGMINSADYQTRIKSFIQNSNSQKIIVTPVDLPLELVNLDNVDVINVPYKHTPQFVEYTGFQDDEIFIRTNNLETSTTAKIYSIDSNNFDEIPLTNKCAIIKDFANKAGCVTLDGKINKYFTQTDIFNVGVTGLDEEFCEFASRVLRNVNFTKYTSFTNDDSIDTWVIADASLIPEIYSKPVVYLNTSNDNNWFSLQDSYDEEIAFTISDGGLLKGVSLNELKFTTTRMITLKDSEWRMKILESGDAVLAGILELKSIERGFINVASIEKNDISMFTLLLNMFEQLSDENLIDRSDYCSMTPNMFLKKLLKIGSSNKELMLETLELIDGAWKSNEITKPLSEFPELLKPMLNTGAIITINEKMFAVSPDISNLEINDSSNLPDFEKLKSKFIPKKTKKYKNTDLILLGIAILLLFGILYVKRSSN